jgi:phage terminase Nu1 subunit (DNA packaging protein)
MTVLEESEVLTVTQLAAHYDVSRQTIYAWRDKNCPIRDGIAAIDKWLESQRPDPAKPKGTLQEQLLAAQIEKTLEESRAKRLKNDEREGLLVDQESAGNQVAEAMTILSARLEQLPDWARRILPAEFRERVASGLEEQIYLALKECAARMRSVADGEGPA